MNRLWFPYWRMIIVVLALFSVGCTVERPEGSVGDIADFVPPQIAQIDTVLRLQPATQQLNVGDSATVEIRIDNVIDLFGVDISLSFDPEFLQVEDTDPDKDGIQIELGDFLSPDFVIDDEADNATGDIFYAATQTAPTPPASGSGVLAIITFRAIAEGSSQLTFTSTDLTAGDKEPIPVMAQPGQITVGPPTGEPTATFTPTSTSEPGQPTDTSTPTATLMPGQDTPTPTVTPSVQPTVGPAETPTPSPTLTLVPTPVPSPTNTPVPLADLPRVPKIPLGATKGFCYRVQHGDTLYSLGQKFGVDPHFINLVNDLSPPGYIFLHQALFIPEAYGSGPNVYQVKIGDTLSVIADQCHLFESFLAQVNNLEVGERLFLNKGDSVQLEDGSIVILNEDTIRIETLIIPIPPFPPPSRFPYPPSVFPPPYPCRSC